MPRKRKYQRGGSDNPTASTSENSVKKFFRENKKPLKAFGAFVVVALVVVGLVVLVNRDDKSSPHDGGNPSGRRRRRSQIPQVEAETMRTVLAKCVCGVSAEGEPLTDCENVDDIMNDMSYNAVKSCLTNHIHSGENSKTYQQLVAEGLFKDLFNDIEDNKNYILIDEFREEPGITQIVNSIRNYQGDGKDYIFCGSSVPGIENICDNTSVESNRRNTVISDAIHNIYNCTERTENSPGGCDELLLKDSELGYFKNFFLYRRE